MASPFTQVLAKEDAKVRAGLLWGLILLLVQLLIVGIFAWQLPPQIPLWYSQPYGRTQLADRLYFLLIPGISLGALLLHWIMIRFGRRTRVIYLQIIAWLVPLLLFLGVIALLHIVVLVL